jgi:plasmid stability protein
MRRTQIYLDEDLDEQLRRRAAFDHVSAAAIIRAALRAYFNEQLGEPDADDPILAMAGAFRGLPADASTELDRDLYGAGSPAGHGR